MISAKNSTPPKCGSCGRVLFAKFAVVMGYVYILSNAGMPNLLKIGQTSGSIRRRVDQLSAATGVPHPFVIEAYFVSQRPAEDEERLHAALADHRRPGKEFFDLALDSALVHGKEVLGRKAQDTSGDLHGPFRYLQPPVRPSAGHQRSRRQDTKYARQKWRPQVVVAVSDVAIASDVPDTGI